MEKKGVSPVVGTILLIAITVALAAIVAMLVSGLGGRGAAPSVQLSALAEDNGDGNVKLIITHNGGDDLVITDLTVQGSNENGVMTNAVLTPATGTFSVTKSTLTAIFTYGPNSVDKVITVYVIHNPSKQKVYSNLTVTIQA
jgi:flagellin-like protein